MQSSTWTLIIAFVFLLIGIIGKIINKESFSFGTIFHKFYYLGYFLLLVSSFISNQRYSYFGQSAYQDRKKFHIPNIDSSMTLITRQKDAEFWTNHIRLNSDSNQHTKKIEIDYSGISKETDFFINYKLSKTIIIESELPELFKKFKSNLMLVDTIAYNNNEPKVISVQLDIKKVDSILNTWKFDTNYIFRKSYY